jgi:hypothetical protein
VSETSIDHNIYKCECPTEKEGKYIYPYTGMNE